MVDIDFMAFIQSLFLMGAMIMVGMGLWELANRINGGIPLISGALVLGAVYWFDLLSYFR